MNLRPLSKILYGIVTALFLDTGLLLAFIDGAIDWRVFVGGLVATGGPMLAAYLRGEPKENLVNYTAERDAS